MNIFPLSPLVRPQFKNAAYVNQGLHKLRKPLPPVDERISRMINVEGPTHVSLSEGERIVRRKLAWQLC